MKKVFASCMLVLALLTTAGIAAVPYVATKAVSLYPANSLAFPNLDEKLDFNVVAQNCPNPHQECTTDCHQVCDQTGYYCHEVCVTRCHNVCGLF